MSRFDEGIKCDDEGLYSLKPENLMKEIAKIMKGNVVVDAFGGIGGASIALALLGKDVICIEQNPQRLEYAKHNAKIYGVYNKIQFLAGDCMELIPNIRFDSMYFDPPWVGEDFFTKRSQPPRCLTKSGEELVAIAKRTCSFVGFTVPHNFNFNQLIDFQTNYSVKLDYMNSRFLYATFFMDFST